MEKSTKKICFALLVHNKKEIVEQVINNIHYFCPNSTIVVYNGGEDSYLVDNLNVPVCPTSKKVNYGNLSTYFLETMEWLEMINMDYDYFINLDSDVLFFRYGFESFIEEQMKEADYMGVNLHLPDDSWFCGQEFKKDLARWKPFFDVSHFLGVFNVGQVFSKKFVKAIVNHKEKALLKKALEDTPVFGIEEIIFVNLAKQFQFTIKNYPTETYIPMIRFRPHFTLNEFSNYFNRYENSWLLHPVKRVENDPVRQLIYRLQINLYDHVFCNEDFHWNSNKKTVNSLSLPITSRLGYIELVARTNGNNLTHLYKNAEEWCESETFAEGVRGTPIYAEDKAGHFHVISQLEAGGIGYWWRNNFLKNKPWIGPTIVTKNNFKPLLLTQIEEQIITGKSNQKLIRFIKSNKRWVGPFY